MAGGCVMVTTRNEAHAMIDNMSDAEFSLLCGFLNKPIEKTPRRIAAEKRFVAEVTVAKESMEAGNYVTLEELHEFLGV